VESDGRRISAPMVSPVAIQLCCCAGEKMVRRAPGLVVVVVERRLR